MKKSLLPLLFPFVCLALLSCEKEEENNHPGETCSEEICPFSLCAYLDNLTGLQRANLIACSASDKDNPGIVYTFYYPLPGAQEDAFFEADSSIDKPEAYAYYCQRSLPQEEVFNGYLKRFVRQQGKEAFSVVTYKRGDTLHLSDPIRFKQQTKPTVWNDQVQITFRSPLEPTFTWTDQGISDNVIYFQVISDESGRLLSGTYTYTQTFTYYDTSNVVLNVTRQTPPPLESGKSYRFTLMAVSEDNWVNLVIEKDFSL